MARDFREVVIKNKKGDVSYVLVDVEDFDSVNRFKWHLVKGYAVRTVRYGIRKENKKYRVHMHRSIMGNPEGLEVDHKNGNPLDNRKGNLRTCSHKENSRNQQISSANTSGFKGVYWHKVATKWMASIKVDQKNIYLGLFCRKLDAAEAYNNAAVSHFGEFANINIL